MAPTIDQSMGRTAPAWPAYFMPLSGDVLQWMRAWGEAVGQVGLFNINFANSADPLLEREITGRYSYGRQIGRVLDVLAPLVDDKRDLLNEKVGPKVVDEFTALVEDVHRIKHQKTENEIIEAVKMWRNMSPDTFTHRLQNLLRQLEDIA